MATPNPVFIYLGTYRNEAAARDDYSLVQDLHAGGAVGTYDAAVITKDDDGKVHVNKDETATRHGAWGGAAVGGLIGLLFRGPSFCAHWHRSVLVAAVGGAMLLVTGCGPDSTTRATTTPPTTTVPTTTSIPTENQVASSLAAAAASQAQAEQQSSAAAAAAAQAQAEQQSAAAAAAAAAAQAQAEQQSAASAAAADAARQSTAEQAQQAPAPAPAAPQDSGTVSPGAFCSPNGAVGVTVKGTPMVCKATATDSRAGVAPDS